MLWAYLSTKLNSDKTTALFWVTWLMGPLSVWPVVAMFSKNMLTDALLYDVIITVAYYGAMVYFSRQLASLQWWQYAGIVMVLVGTLLVRVK